MSNMPITLDQHTVELDGHSFLITAFKASEGWKLLKALGDGEINDAVMQKAIVDNVSLDNMKLTNDKYDRFFARKYKLVSDLFQEVIKFNFGDLLDPNAGSDTSE